MQEFRAWPSAYPASSQTRPNAYRVRARRTGRFLYDRLMAEEFCDVGRGVTLCYETFGDPDDPPILLIMGLATQMIAWHEDFCEQLAERGFYVVRFDNRDIGRSTHFDFRPPRSSRARPVGSTRAVLALRHGGGHRRPAGELGDRAAHVVGASMGGMIGQMLARRASGAWSARSPRSCRRPGSRWHGQPALSASTGTCSPAAARPRRLYPARRPSSSAGRLDRLRPRRAVHPRAGRGRSYDRGFDVRAGGRQLRRDRRLGRPHRRALRRIKAPTLVIHGTVDKMIRPVGGRATAKAIPGARLMMIEGMGHDLPRGVWPQIIDAISEHARARRRGPARPRPPPSAQRARRAPRPRRSRSTSTSHRAAATASPAWPGRGTRPPRRSARARARCQLLLDRRPVVRVVDVPGRVHLRGPEDPGRALGLGGRIRVAQSHVGVAPRRRSPRSRR